MLSAAGSVTHPSANHNFMSCIPPKMNNQEIVHIRFVYLYRLDYLIEHIRMVHIISGLKSQKLSTERIACVTALIERG